MKTKIENKLQSIYKESKHDIKCDNRSYYTKSINNAMSNPLVELKLCEKGFVWTRKTDSYKYNLVIRINGKGKIFNIKNKEPETIADCFASVTNMPHVKESIHIYQDAYICEKCHGKGIIPSFMHVCKGVCFDCLGIGYRFHSMNH